jgi:hypothetical protein
MSNPKGAFLAFEMAANDALDAFVNKRPHLCLEYLDKMKELAPLVEQEVRAMIATRHQVFANNIFELGVRLAKEPHAD